MDSIFTKHIHFQRRVESLVCGDSWRGILCSNCSEGFTLLYHSPNYECRNESLVNCSYGIALYIVSELLPVTLLFLVILIFNINFTSAALSSFVFYAQVIDLQGADMINSRYMYTFKMFKTFYDSFNLNIDIHSFCLISNANQMQLQCILGYPNLDYPNLCLSQPTKLVNFHEFHYNLQDGC